MVYYTNLKGVVVVYQERLEAYSPRDTCMSKVVYDKSIQVYVVYPSCTHYHVPLGLTITYPLTSVTLWNGLDPFKY